MLSSFPALLISIFILATLSLAELETKGFTEPREPTFNHDVRDTRFEKRMEDKMAVIGSTNSTFLVIALATSTPSQLATAKSGLNDYGIPFELLLVPSGNVILPQLNSSATTGNYGGIVILSELSYSYVDSSGATIWTSALSTDQWTALFNYQISFGVRMVRLGAFPSNSGEQDSGTQSLGGCCDYNVENYMTIHDASQFKTAGLVQDSALSAMNLWHNPAVIADSSYTTSFANFLLNPNFPAITVGGVINNFPTGRQQMVFFMTLGTDWSLTSNLLTHAWIHWATRGLYAGYRRAMLNTQVDDMFLTTKLWTSPDPSGNYRVVPSDLEGHIPWMASINSRLPSGSNYTIELGHNGNGNIGVCNCCVLPCLNETFIHPKRSVDSTPNEAVGFPMSEKEKRNKEACPLGVVDYYSPPPVDDSFIKPAGVGVDYWPSSLIQNTSYPYTLSCLSSDPLGQWFMNATNRDAFLHVSHTFTHELETNATYQDVVREITWNQKWADQIGLSAAKFWSPKGIIPPAITGTNNADALRAWRENGIVNVVGDNTRYALRNKFNDHWPLNTTVKDNGLDGIQITPRWATRIYYNCDLVDCDVQQWATLPQNTGGITALLDLERATNVNNIITLHHDPFMFHQANMRKSGASLTTVNGVPGNFSLLQMWVETIAAEYTKMVNWPLITLKHDDLAFEFKQRITRDMCNYTMSYSMDFTRKVITGITVGSLYNNCSAPIPVTVPGSLWNSLGFKTEQIGSDPLTVWVPLKGSPVTLELDKPVPW